MMKILLLSAYDAASHVYWRKSLVANFPEYDWTVLALPSRYFSWRLRGNSLSWAFGQREVLQQHYDLILATSMTDLSALRGFVPSLAVIPSIVYFHENQFSYPESNKAHSSVEPKILNIYTALAADRILFNSHYNRDTFLQGASDLLKKLPDQVPLGLTERLTQCSQVLPVPLADDLYLPQARQSQAVRCAWHQEAKPASFANVSADARPILIVWAARWEYDKAPDRLLAIMRELERRDLDYRMCIMGEKFRQTPQEFATIEQEFAHRLDQFGFAASRDLYVEWLCCADIVLSTATHEYQGLAVLEAVAQGCIPVLPNRQVYPELFGSEYVYTDGGDDIESEASAAADMIELRGQSIRERSITAPTADRFRWSALKSEYEEVFQQLAGR